MHDYALVCNYIKNTILQYIESCEFEAILFFIYYLIDLIRLILKYMNSQDLFISLLTMTFTFDL